MNISHWGLKTSHLDAVRESAEQRSEAYREYVERVAEALTMRCAKNAPITAALPAGLGRGAEVSA